jgi:hypothetical protein
MNDHLEPLKLEEYLSRTLSPAALLAADDHLAQCTECRERAALSAPPIRQLRRSFAPAHLNQDSLAAYAEGRLSDAAARAHLRECAQCREEAEDLLRFVREGTRTAPAREPRVWWRLAAAAAVCALVVGAMILRSRQESVRIAAVAPATRSLPADLRELRDEALKDGRVAIPAGIVSLRGETETQLGGGAPDSQPELQTPVGTGILTARPEFRWKPVPGAQQYEAIVFDANAREIASSGPLQQPEWTPAQDLDSGEVYFWELTVLVNGKRITAPRPPAPQARFLVIPETDRARLADLAVRFPQEHVLLGVLYARAGALDEARQQWRTAIASGHPEAARLLDSI